jgi:hypothetical protein
MIVSTRTPDGEPFRCPMCGKASTLEASVPPGDAACPHCGGLLWRHRDKWSIADQIRPLLHNVLGGTILFAGLLIAFMCFGWPRLSPTTMIVAGMVAVLGFGRHIPRAVSQLSTWMCQRIG